MGTGFIVGDEQMYIITCAHVVEAVFDQNFKPEMDVPFQFVGAPEIEPRPTARVCTWLPIGCRSDLQSSPEDIAVLSVTRPPESVKGLRRLGLGIDGEEVSVYGFCKGYSEGHWVNDCRLENAIASGLVQFSGEGFHKFFVKPGFSGAPVWRKSPRHENNREVLGIVTLGDGQHQAAFMIPSGMLLTALPEGALGDETLRSEAVEEDTFAIETYLQFMPCKRGALQWLTPEANEHEHISTEDFLCLWKNSDLVSRLMCISILIEAIKLEGLPLGEAKTWARRLFNCLVPIHPQAPQASDMRSEMTEARRRGGLLALKLEQGEVQARYQMSLPGGLGTAARAADLRPFFDSITELVMKRRQFKSLDMARVYLAQEVFEYFCLKRDIQKKPKFIDSLTRPTYFSLPADIADTSDIEKAFAAYLELDEGEYLHIYTHKAESSRAETKRAHRRSLQMALASALSKLS